MADNQHANHSPNNDQAKKFKDMARELEADESPEHFERVVQHVVSAPVPSKEAKPVSKRQG